MQLLARRGSVRDCGEGAAAEVPQSTIDVRTKFRTRHLLRRLQLDHFAQWSRPLNPHPHLRTTLVSNQATMISLHTFRATFSRRCVAATSGVRTYASQTPGNPMVEIFNRKAKHLQKDRAARNVEESRKTDYLKDEVALRLCERLLVRHSSKQGP